MWLDFLKCANILRYYGPGPNPHLSCEMNLTHTDTNFSRTLRNHRKSRFQCLLFCHHIRVLRWPGTNLSFWKSSITKLWHSKPCTGLHSPGGLFIYLQIKPSCDWINRVSLSKLLILFNMLIPILCNGFSSYAFPFL